MLVRHVLRPVGERWLIGSSADYLYTSCHGFNFQVFVQVREDVREGYIIEGYKLRIEDGDRIIFFEDAYNSLGALVFMHQVPKLIGMALEEPHRTVSLKDLVDTFQGITGRAVVNARRLVDSFITTDKMTQLGRRIGHAFAAVIVKSYLAYNLFPPRSKDGIPEYLWRIARGYFSIHPWLWGTHFRSTHDADSAVILAFLKYAGEKYSDDENPAVHAIIRHFIAKLNYLHKVHLRWANAFLDRLEKRWEEFAAEFEQTVPDLDLVLEALLFS